jgi:hypothetical protein
MDAVLATLAWISRLSGSGWECWVRKIHAWPPNTRLPDALFKALAIIPMTGMAPGVPQQKLPFDLDELLRLVQE